LEAAATPLRSWEYVEGWGMAVGAHSRVLRPRSVEEIAACFRAAREQGLCLGLRGTGNSYGDASVNRQGWVLDVSRMNEVLGWSPPHSLDAGLQKTITWYLANKATADART